MRARTVADVIAGEAVSGTPQERFRDMMAIASAVVNRANALGVTPQDVVANPHEFNAYSRPMPAGTENYRSMAQKAIDAVMANGPVHPGMFYATPAAADNLPSGLTEVGDTTGHKFFSDPRARAINTAVGYRTPSAIAQQQLAQLAGVNVPAPETRPAMPAFTAPVTPVTRQELAAPTVQSAQEAPSMAQRQSIPQSIKDQLTQGLLSQAQNMAQQSFQSTPGYQSLREQLNKQANDYPSTVSPLDGYPMSKEQRFPSDWGVPKTTYVDPQVTTGVAPATPYAATPTDTAAVGAINGQMPGIAANGYNPNTGYTADKAAMARAAQADMNHKISGLLGTIGGAAIGGLLAGPVGGLLGGWLGKTGVSHMGYPSAPSGGTKSNKQLSRSDLDGAGKGLYDRSSQVRDVVDHNSPGLW